MSKVIKQQVYLVMEPRWSTWRSRDDPPDEFVVTKTLKTKPDKPQAGLVMELTLELDDDIFDPIQPSASIKLERDKADETSVARVVGKRVKSHGAISA